ncbi:MAG: iron-containing alcohol dehydrogenase family protein [Dehalococcoidia bacterium]|nr:iron-containing alcohol dehydrogenase family protein [Dehalococcoidia bacterium]MDP6227287.1 iron-containing alcohol dehydrogenase family protein [Dehalococcoidia bacterium]MDP7083564.1 iron-containing alcohol dehydrogenase family protein [Dehalococcoidia bacterium]MDP7199342.1 iron-containing alcohol dehydrogenase family protein [Dehalococcoidia bacterium]MDP7510062.1 iron-containing alcohol dehydrogenase family protein [Dehalococcoidia bacterium]
MPGPNSFRISGYSIRVHAGDDAIARLSDEADRARAKRVFVVCGQSVAHRTDLLNRVRDVLGGRLAGVFDGAQTGSPVPSVTKGAAMAAEAGADLIVAVGGGSAVVTARAITILLAEGGTARDHATKYPQGLPPVSPRLMQPKIPNVLVLTTPTTAATRAGTAVIDPETGHRLELFDPKTRPAALIWDTRALLTAPPSLCVSAAASCYSGVVGALQSRERLNPLAGGDLVQALRLLQENLPLVALRPDAGEVRLNLSAAAFLYNRAGDSGAGGSAVGVVSAMAHSLDTRYPECDHGAAYAILTAPGMRFNRDHNLAGQARLASVMGVRQHSMENDAAARAAADAVAQTFNSLGLPARLSQVGVGEEGVKLLAEDTMTDFALHRNVRPVKEVSELEELLREIW